MKRFTHSPIAIICLMILTLIIEIILTEIRYHPLGKRYNNYALDSSDPYKSCAELPPVSDATKIVADNVGELDKLKEFDNGIYWWIDSEKCNGEKSELLIFYGSHQSRLEIEKIIKNNDFHGLPTSLNNI